MGHLPLDGLVLRHKSARSFASDASYVSSCLSWLVTSRIPALLRHLVMKAGGRHFTRLYPFLSLSLCLSVLFCWCVENPTWFLLRDLMAARRHPPEGTEQKNRFAHN